MSSIGTCALPAYSPPLPQSRWYALHTRARHEKAVTHRLSEHGITTYLPMTNEVRQWSDRRKRVELPLFSCYTFVQVPSISEVRSIIVRTDGVLGFVGYCGGEVPIPDSEIDNVRMLLESTVPYTTHPFLKIGQRIRVRSGALDGLEGILVGRNGDSTLVISVDPIQRSLAVKIDGYAVETV